MSTLLYKEIIIPPVLNPDSISSLNKQLHEAEMDNQRFLVLRGAGGSFCNGMDLAWVVNQENDDHIGEMQEYGNFLKKLQTGKFISIAHVNGTASGGGMGIVCACDHVIANEASTFSLPEGLFGLIPGMIMPSLLNRLTPQRIKKMVLTGKKYSSEIAVEWGIADEIHNNNDIEAMISAAINSMRSCKTSAVADLKESLYVSHFSKDELGKLGMDLLKLKLADPDIKQKLRDIVDFM